MAANGQAQAPSSDEKPSPFANVALAIDAYTIDAASGKRKLRTIEPDGTLTYDEPKPPRVKYGEDLNRIWNEYPGGLMDLSEEKLRTMDAEDLEPAPEDAEASEREKWELLSPEEMEALRSEVCNNLNNARNELWYIFELAKSLAASNGIPTDPPPEPLPSAPAPKKGKAKAAAASTAQPTPSASSAPPPPAAAAEDGPILPGGTYTTTPAAPPTRNEVETAHALELAIAAKQAALEDCAALIDAAVDELRLLNTASDQWSSDIRTLRLGDKGRGQWAIVPKPDFGRTQGASSNETAKDVVIPYALDEAPAAVHARSLAAFDLDPRKAHILAFGARSYHRLRVMVRTGGVGGPRTASKAYSAEGESERGVRAMMEAAQLETLDEDLFNELRAEAMRLDSAMIEKQSIALPLGKEKITFQLYDTREEPSPPAPHSPICDGLLAHARLGLLHAYRRRKQRLIDTSVSHMPGPTPPPSASILVPIVHLMQFYGACKTVQPTLETLRSTLAAAGLDTALVERHAAAGNPDAVLAFLAARAKIDVLGATYTLELPGSSGITVNITAPSSISIVTQRSSFLLKDIDSLGAIMSEALVAQLAPWLYESVRDEDKDTVTAAGRERVFFDELDGVLVLDAYGPLKVSIPSPFTHLVAAFGLDDSVQPYDSREGGSLLAWLVDVVKGMPAE